MIEFIQQPWHWLVSGVSIAFIMFLMLFFGKTFGLSSNFRTICAACGVGKNVSYFNYDWRSQTWNLAFLMGCILGGYVSHHFLSTGEPVQIAQATISDLRDLGFAAPTGMQPMEIYGIQELSTLKGFLILAVGGLLIGFGTRYADGCTSGHAISGLSNFQLPSLIAVIGFFIGGLVMTYFILPPIF